MARHPVESKAWVASQAIYLTTVAKMPAPWVRAFDA
jgi:hypothetical protein